MDGSRRASWRRGSLDPEVGEVLGERLRLVLDLRAVGCQAAGAQISSRFSAPTTTTSPDSIPAYSRR